MILRYAAAFFTLLLLTSGHAAEPIRLAYHPGVSPDGSKIVFSWRGDIWTSSAEGGQARRLTTHAALDSTPQYTPDGQSICFTSKREGSSQVYIMPSSGGTARQLTFHSEGSVLQDIAPDGKSILVEGVRDYEGARPFRLLQVSIEKESTEQMAFDAHAKNGRFSPDGKSIIFTREGTKKYRKGYHGSQASQIWIWNRNKDGKDSFNQPVTNNRGCRTPVYSPNSSGFYYASGEANGFNLWHYDNKTKRQITFFEDDTVMDVTISRDGSLLLFRHLFDIYSLPLTDSEGELVKPKQLKLWHNEDLDSDDSIELNVKETKDADFSPSGLEIVFVAEGDLWAMDTVLRKPNRLTHTSEYEKDVWFSHDGKSIFYIHDNGIQTELRSLKKSDPSKYWWEVPDVEHAVVVQADARPLSLVPGPKGKKIAYTTFPGNLWISNPDGSEPKRLLESWSEPRVRWSPDGKWLAYSLQNDDFNSDIYIIATDGSNAPINISKHPDNDFMPAWSPDGRKLAFVGRHHKEAYDLFYVDLYHSDVTKDKDTETLEKARKLMKKDPAYKVTAKKVVKEAIDSLTKEKKKPKAKESFDLENITQRVRRLEIKNSRPNKIIWHSDSKRILFQTSTAKNIFAIEAKEGSKPSKFAEATGNPLRMDPKEKLYWISGGTPALLSKGKNTKYPFNIYTERNQEAWKLTAFKTAWKTMRDNFYDPAMNNRNWDQIREKYEDMAAFAPNSNDFDRVLSMMLGELNASHLGFRSKEWPLQPKQKPAWTKTTVHLGIHFDSDHQGKGWRVKSIIPNSPATYATSKIEAGELITKIDDQEVSSNTPLTALLNRRIAEPLLLTIIDKKAKERQVKIRPISYSAARSLVKDAHIDKTEATVHKLSNGKLGYIHIARMLWDEFEKFEHHLYEQGADKEGIVIDVRDNGGGFTTDHLLTALCQPRHAYTIPRNGGIGYPQDRTVYATWNKPIIVLCNQNSFSNAEIFAHAIRNLGRGKVVGVRTAGGVISTGQVDIMGARMRMPFRGWFDNHTGEDMELNGTRPHYLIKNKPGELSAGIDNQLEKAVSVLMQECSEAKKTPPAKYRSEDRRPKP